MLGHVIIEALLLIASGAEASQITHMGISTHRATFTLWHRDTMEPVCNFITWKDNRAAEIVESWNGSLTFSVRFVHSDECNRCLHILQVIHFIFGILYALSGYSRFLLMKVMRLISAMCMPRIMWLMKRDPQVHKCRKECIYTSF